MRMSARTFALVCSLALIPSFATAQTSHAASQSAIDAALQQKTTTAAGDREMVRQLLERPEIRAVAGHAGLDLKRAQDAVATLDEAQLAQVASQARQVEQSLAGGQSKITISTTFLIIALLVLILLIVALK